VAQQPGQLHDLGVLVGLAVGAQPGGPVPLADGVDRGPSAGVDRPADRVLHPPPPLAVRGGGVEFGEVVDQAMGGAGPVHGHQHVGAEVWGELRDRGINDGDVVGGRKRPRRPGPQHRRQGVPDVGAPGGEGMESVALVVGFGAVLVRGSLDHGGVQPDHDHRPALLPVLPGGAAQVGPGDPDGGQTAVPVDDRCPGLRASPGQCAGQAPAW
jgi:hypothetical protein